MKFIGRLILSAIFLVLTGLLAAVAHSAPEVVFAFYPALSRAALAAISSVTSLVPFAVWEILALLAILWAVYTLVRSFSRRRGFLSWAAGVVLAASVGLFAFVALWGLNHFGPGVAPELGLKVRDVSRQELIAATRYYADELTRCSEQVDRRSDGTCSMPDFSALSAVAGRGYERLSERYELFTGSFDPVKPLLSWRMFSQFGTTGIFVCLTGESCVNPDTYEAWIPYTMCHELAHRQAVAAEDEANFCAYLACMASDDRNFRYSGAFGAYVYCHNALSSVDKQAAADIWNSLDAGVLADLHAANDHYAQYEGAVQDAAQQVNDAYLKAFSEESGVQSYGEVTDLLIAWYLQNNA